VAEVVEPVNFNGPGQTVIAGSKAAVERACEGCKARGAKRALLLPVSAPFHSSLMRPAATSWQPVWPKLSFAAPQIPVINNVDVAIESDPAGSRTLWFGRPTRRCAGSRRSGKWPPWT
jgi:[acyl-carrier-protein] S-malonyltransferase